jgi:tetratricopeptide (TPR) repeat protein
VEVLGTPLAWSDSAVAAATRAIELSPDQAAGYASRACAFYLQGHQARALDDPNRALELAPGDARARNTRAATLHFGQGASVEALVDGLEGARLDPQWPFPDNIVGVIYGDLGDRDEAEAWLDQALAVQPDFVWAQWNLAVTHRRQGRLAEEREVIASMRRAAPRTINPLLVSLRSESQDENWPQVVRDYEQLARLEPRQTYGVDYRLRGGIAYRALGDSARALALVGRSEEALGVLEQWVAAGAIPSPLDLAEGPFESLRNEPRFIALVSIGEQNRQRMRLEVESRGLLRAPPPV